MSSPYGFPTRSVRYFLLPRDKSKKLPKTLWRVQHDGSQAGFDEDNDLSADVFADPDMDAEMFKDALESHLWWSRWSEPSFMISTFDNKKRAVNWGRQRHKKGGSARVCLYKIAVKDLVGVKALPLSSLVDFFELELGPKVEVSQEWIIFNWIPSEAWSLECDLVAEIRKEEEMAAELEREISRLAI